MTLSFRRAEKGDVAALSQVMGPEPSQEQLGLSGGDERKARRFRALAMSHMWGPVGLEATTVVVADDEIVGFVQSGAEGAESITISVVWGVVRIFGFPSVLGFARRDRARARVHIRPPADAYHIAEIHVLATRRNLGIGATLLEEAERAARAQGSPRMSLTTTTNNPARHLYERFGFRLVETREDHAYLASTGISGHILMVKDLA